jgi:hypothetical protein
MFVWSVFTCHALLCANRFTLLEPNIAVLGAVFRSLTIAGTIWFVAREDHADDFCTGLIADKLDVDIDRVVAVTVLALLASIHFER